MSAIPTKVTKDGVSGAPKKPKPIKREVPATTIMRNEIHELEVVLRALRADEDAARERMEATILENEALAKDRRAQWADAQRQLEAVRGEHADLERTLKEVKTNTNLLKERSARIKAHISIEEDVVSRIPSAPAPVAEDGITLVFTDIEDSTNHWEWNYDVMKEALDIHNEIMRDQMKLMGGYEVRTEGDAFVIAFEKPVDAVRWCLSVQVALLHADWPEKLFEFPASKVVRGKDGALVFRGVRVRMGAHTGYCEQETDPNTGRAHYIGPMVNRAERIGSAGHGGQILVGQDTWLAIEEHINGELGSPVVAKLGAHRLKDLNSDEELYSLVPNGLDERSFPIPKSQRPPTSLIAEFIAQLSSQTEDLEANFAETEASVQAMVHEGQDLIEQIEGIVGGFQAWQKRSLLDSDDKLVALMLREQDLREELEEYTILERNARRGMSAMDHVLTNVSKQLDVVPKLEERIRILRDDLKTLKMRQQEERLDYIKELDGIQEHIKLYRAAHAEAVAQVGEIKHWSDMDQLGINTVKIPKRDKVRGRSPVRSPRGRAANRSGTSAGDGVGGGVGSRKKGGRGASAAAISTSADGHANISGNGGNGNADDINSVNDGRSASGTPRSAAGTPGGSTSRMSNGTRLPPIQKKEK